MLNSMVGSSPLARGLLLTGLKSGQEDRIIPARAGFTLALTLTLWLSWDHPRSRGVYHPNKSPTPLLSGSSPLARGLPRPPMSRCSSGGIIPARAGFTTCVRWCRSHGWDHPRSRGVYNQLHLLALLNLGSSPLARGLLASSRDIRGVGGIIPARAGFTRRICDVEDVG